MVEDDSRLQGAVGVECKACVVEGAVAVDERKDVGGIGVGIGGVELAHFGTCGQVFSHRGVGKVYVRRCPVLEDVAYRDLQVL